MDNTKPEASNKKKFFTGCLPFIIIIILGIYAISTTERPEKTYSLPEHGVAYGVITHLLENDTRLEQHGFNEIDCPFADYRHDYLNDSSYLVVSYYKYKTDFGVEKRLNYKARIKWTGGDPDSLKNWEMIYIEEFNSGI